HVTGTSSAPSSSKTGPSRRDADDSFTSDPQAMPPPPTAKPFRSTASILSNQTTTPGVDWGQLWRADMDKDRVEGAVHQVKGSVKETVGKVTGDAKTQAEGAAEKAAGKVQNAVGGAKDAVRKATKK